METEYHSLDWFIERIGRRIFRNNNCTCRTCVSVYNDGIIVGDEEQARWMHCYEGEGDKIRYFDT